MAGRCDECLKVVAVSRGCREFQFKVVSLKIERDAESEPYSVSLKRGL